jgi:NTP pyrophosphatase (non-canonical NTP hydrolase)
MENINEYGEFVERVWFSTPMENGERKAMSDRDLTIMALGLGGESAEVVEKMKILTETVDRHIMTEEFIASTGKVLERIKKHIRDTPLDKEALLKELGDTLYYTVRLAQFFGFKPSDIINANVHKLQGRIERGTQRGSGDNR